MSDQVKAFHHQCFIGVKALYKLNVLLLLLLLLLIVALFSFPLNFYLLVPLITIISVKDIGFQVHKTILCKCSPYFWWVHNLISGKIMNYAANGRSVHHNGHCSSLLRHSGGAAQPTEPRWHLAICQTVLQLWAVGSSSLSLLIPLRSSFPVTSLRRTSMCRNTLTSWKETTSMWERRVLCSSPSFLHWINPRDRKTVKDTSMYFCLW